MNNAAKFPPNLDPQVYSLIAVLVGSACCNDYDANEQNSIGNWLMLVAQYILTHAAQQQLIEARMENYNININSKSAKNGGSIYGQSGKSNQNQRSEVDFLLQAVRNLEKELRSLKDKINKN